ncbi:hypothetical protein SASPL_140625 [Salvia splendens]|uniref:Alcohol dehydrogenase-like N-terminal domain-containing protein n=1 Tax=Salvia splendens TaxID=180675 RepID=A0A8X8WP47_SALSN|nr:hypothetical protein SASPL_140625 [Salvia splendens]
MGSLGSNNNYEDGIISSDTVGKVITCKAAVAYGAGQPLVVEEIRVDPPHKMEVRIRVLFTSICHTDLSAWKGESEAQRAFPRILGHEASGVVESVGEGVSGLEIGDHVIPIFNGECEKCVYCKSKKTTNLCEKFRVNPMKSTMASDGKCRFSTKDGKSIFHFLNTSTFSEYTVLDSACVVKIDRMAPLDKMTLLSCGVSTGLGAVWNTADVEEGSTVVVFGLGAVGLAVVEGARTRGASRIIGVDINSEKQIKGKAIGLTDFINPKELDKPVHEGWGLTVLLGVHPSPRLLPLHPMEMFDGRRLVGSVFGDFKGKSQLPHFANQCTKGEVKLEEFITHEMPFSKINDAMQLLLDGKSLRCLLHL